MYTKMSKLCKVCNLPDQEFYPNRRQCKKCYSQTVIEKKKGHILCPICKTSKTKKHFNVSKKTGTHKPTCNDCRINSYSNTYMTCGDITSTPRYKVLNDWMKGLLFGAQPEDIDILIRILSNF